MAQTSAPELKALRTSAQDFLQYDYDYVVVGGGCAGLVVAARLSEDPNVTVGVLEAGKNRLDDPLVDSPAAFLAMLNNPEYDWQIYSEPQEHNRGRRHQLPRGKLLGGSAAINYMLYVRGSKQDYDDWAIIAGDEAWNGEEMMKYMKKHQTLEPIDDYVTDRTNKQHKPEFHGTSGPARTSYNNWHFPIEDDFIHACSEVTGLKEKPNDPFSGDHIGFFNTLGLVYRTGPHRGKRSYPARGYFEENSHRPNLHVLCEATVHNIELDGDKAVGVKFEHAGQTYTVPIRQEVICAAGSFMTPQVLELSGIGNPEVLKAAGVDCKVVNHAIGENFNDHVLTTGVYALKDGHMNLEQFMNPMVMQKAMEQLEQTGGGPLTSISSSQGYFPYKMFATPEEQERVIQSAEASLPHLTPYQRKQYERTIAHLKDDKSANLQIVLVPATHGGAEGIEDQSKIFPPPSDPNALPGMTAAMSLQYPLSRGSIHIRTSNPRDHPSVNPRLLSHPADVDVLAAGLKMIGKVESSPHLSDKIAHRIFPVPEYDMANTEHMRESVRDMVMSMYHGCGTAAMGDAVDTRLRVNGCQGIRVVDASVFPNQVSGNIVATVYAVAEKAADLIKEDYRAAVLATGGA